MNVKSGTAYCVCYVMYSVLCMLCRVQCVVYSVLCMLCRVQCVMYSLLCMLCHVQCIMYSVLCTLCHVQCVMYSLLLSCTVSHKSVQTRLIVDTAGSGLCICLA